MTTWSGSSKEVEQANMCFMAKDDEVIPYLSTLHRKELERLAHDSIDGVHELFTRLKDDKKDGSTLSSNISKLETENSQLKETIHSFFLKERDSKIEIQDLHDQVSILEIENKNVCELVGELKDEISSLKKSTSSRDELDKAYILLEEAHEIIDILKCDLAKSDRMSTLYKEKFINFESDIEKQILKIDSLTKTLHNLTKGEKTLEKLLSSQRRSLNKEDLGFDPSSPSVTNDFVRDSNREPYNLIRVKCFNWFKYDYLNSRCQLLKDYRITFRKRQ